MKNYLTKFLVLLGVFLTLGAGQAYADWVKFPGDFNKGDGNDNWDWNTGWETDGNGMVSHDFTTHGRAGGYGFKVQVWNGSTNTTYSTGGEITLGAAWTTISGDNNNNMWFDAKANTTYTFEWNNKTKQLRIYEKGSLGPSETYVNTGGSFSNNEYNGVQPVNKIATLYDQNIGTKGFKIKVWDGTDTYYYYPSTTLETEKWIKLTKGTSSSTEMKIKDATANDIYIVKYNVETNQIFVEKQPIYLFNTVGKDEWNLGFGKGATLNGSNYTWNNVVITNSGSGNGFLILSTRYSKDWNDETGINKFAIGSNNNEDPLITSDNTHIGWGNNWKVTPGVYTVTLTADRSKISISKLPDVTTWALHGQIGGQWKDQFFTQSDEDKNLWTVSIPGQASGEFGIEKIVNGWYNDKGNDWYGVNGTISETNNTLTLEQKGGVNSKFDLDPKKIYTFTWNTKTNKLSVEESNHVYLYGHVNGGSWAPGNFVELTYNPTTGYFEALVANITGQWNDHDNNLDNSRVPRTSTKNEKYENGENYVAFYPQIQTETSFDRKRDRNLKFGYAGVKEGEGNLDPTNLNTWYKIDFMNEKTSNNFRIDDGYYKVEFDLAKKQAQFTKTNETLNSEGKIVKTYSWYSGDDWNDDKLNTKRRTFDEELGVYTYSFVATQTDRNAVQVALYSNPEHDVARQATYTVMKRNNNGSTGAKRKALDKNEFNTKANEGTDYVIDGSSEFHDNVLVHILQPGEYLITAELHDEENAYLVNNQKVSDVYDVNSLPSSILVNAMKAEVETSDDNTQSVPFDPSGTITLEGGISFSEELKYGTDFTVTIVADEDSKNWPSTNSDPTEDDYKEKLTLTTVGGHTNMGLFNQYTTIASAAENNFVDGFYYEDGIEFVDATTSSTESNYEYDLQFKVPCSGVYQFEVAPKSGGSYSFSAFTLTVKVYPNLQATFGTDAGFNIEGYAFDTGYHPVNDDEVSVQALAAANNNFQIVVPVEKLTGKDLSQLVAYCPGTFFATNFGEEANGPTNLPKDDKKMPYPYAYYTHVDLSNLATTDKDLTIYVSKNGATGSYVFPVTSKGDTFVTTGVEAIGSEDGEAVYYNLQGVKVENPEHGIYVKVVNGKATKVVL